MLIIVNNSRLRYYARLIRNANEKINRGTLIKEIPNFSRVTKKALVFSLDLVLSVFATWFALLLRLEMFNPFLQVPVYPLLIAPLMTAIIFHAFRLYNVIWRYFGMDSLLHLGRALGIYGVLFFLLFTVIGATQVPRSLGLMQPVLLSLAVVISRVSIFAFLQVISNSDSASRRLRVLIYGANSAGRQLAGSLEASVRYQFVGFIDDDPSLRNSTIDSKRVYPARDVISVIRTNKVDQLWLAFTDAENIQRQQLIEALGDQTIKVLTLPNFSDLADGKVRVSDVRELELPDLLGRAPVTPISDLLHADTENQIVMVTGAGGSIGSELCRQIIAFKPSKLLLVDHSEYALYSVYQELKKISDDMGNQHSEDWIIPILGSTENEQFINRIFKTFNVDVTYHAAAYKHVDIVEKNVIRAVENNVWGALNCLEAARDANIKKFVLISTDKAVRPTNIMGVSKRIAEMALQAIQAVSSHSGNRTIFTIVRFGNVLNSSGSVLPLFRQQLAERRAITVTDPEVSRYFMTIEEAAGLVIQAGAMANGGEVFILDMGEPIKIVEFAKRLINLSGLTVRDNLNPKGDIEIKFTGLRPGEKIQEELLIDESAAPTLHESIRKGDENFWPWERLSVELSLLRRNLKTGDISEVREILQRLVTTYTLAAHDANCSIQKNETFPIGP